MEKIIQTLINNWTKGVDTYTHNGSTWLIFTEQKSWVIELTESKTLWYNYNFFKELFSLTSMDVVDNQHYITKWVEDNLINKVKDTILEKNITEGEVDDIIQDGVKETKSNNFIVSQFLCEEIIKNGVKETFNFDEKHSLSYEQGVKKLVEDTIKNGVRHIEIGWHQCNNVDDAIEKGVKETKTPGKDGDIMSTVEWMEENNSSSYTKMIDDVIENGIKGTFDTEFMPKAIVEDIIQNGTKKPSV
jgi:hypothetical protein